MRAAVPQLLPQNLGHDGRSLGGACRWRKMRRAECERSFGGAIPFVNMQKLGALYRPNHRFGRGTVLLSRTGLARGLQAE